MRDTINRNNRIAEENTLLTGHPAKDKFGEWSSELIEKTDTSIDETENPAESERRRLHKLEQIDEVINENLDRE